MRYQDLLNVPTVEEVQARMLETAASRGAQVGTWKTKSIPSIVLWAVAYLAVTIYQLIAYFASGVNFSANTDRTLVVTYGKSQFGTTPLAATAAKYTAVLVSTVPTTQKYTFTTPWGTTFSSTVVDLIADTPTTVEFVADIPGSQGNVSTGSLTLTTYEAGLTVTDITQTVTGVDEESTEDYIARSLKSWGGLGAASTEFVELLAVTMDSTLTRVTTRVDSTENGEMIIYLSQGTTVANEEQVALFQQRIDSLAIFKAANCVVASATDDELILAGTVYCTETPSTVQAEVEKAIAVLQGGLRYGQSVYKYNIWQLFPSKGIKKVDLSLADEYTTSNSWSFIRIVSELEYVNA